MTDTDTTRNTESLAADASYLASEALADLATVIGRDLLPVPIGIAPPAHGFELEVHVRHEDMLTWLGSVIHRQNPQSHRLRNGDLSRRIAGDLDGTGTRVELCWIEETTS